MAYYRAVKRKLGQAGWKNTAHRRKNLTPHDMFDYRRVPMSRLIDKLGLSAYRDYAVPLNEQDRRPGQVRIPLKQHIGVPTAPTVKEGDKVKPGDLIASIPDDKLGANVHASVSGRVEEVTENCIRIKTG